MSQLKFVLAVLVASLGTCFANAQNTVFQVPAGGMVLRTAPPGFFSGKGDPIGTLQSGQYLQIIETKSVQSINGTQNWLKVIQRSPNSNLTGWVYSGK